MCNAAASAADSLRMAPPGVSGSRLIAPPWSSAYPASGCCTPMGLAQMVGSRSSNATLVNRGGASAAGDSHRLPAEPLARLPWLPMRRGCLGRSTPPPVTLTPAPAAGWSLPCSDAQDEDAPPPVAALYVDDEHSLSLSSAVAKLPASLPRSPGGCGLLRRCSDAPPPAPLFGCSAHHLATPAV
jgi:hypothetical protein